MWGRNALGTGHAQHAPQVSSSQPYSYTEPSWTSSHSGTLSSLLNLPTSNGYSTRPTPTINTSYTPSYLNVSMHSNHTSPSLSPDTHSRPTTGYSISSVSSLPYEESPTHRTYQNGTYSRPGSSHRRSGSPTTLSWPPSSSKQYGPSSFSQRPSSTAPPYPSPYELHTSERSSSPHPADDLNVNIPRVRGMAHLPSVGPPLVKLSFLTLLLGAIHRWTRWTPTMGGITMRNARRQARRPSALPHMPRPKRTHLHLMTRTLTRTSTAVGYISLLMSYGETY